MVAVPDLRFAPSETTDPRFFLSRLKAGLSFGFFLSGRDGVRVFPVALFCGPLDLRGVLFVVTLAAAFGRGSAVPYAVSRASNCVVANAEVFLCLVKRLLDPFRCKEFLLPSSSFSRFLRDPFLPNAEPFLSVP